MTSKWATGWGLSTCQIRWFIVYLRESWLWDSPSQTLSIWFFDSFEWTTWVNQVELTNHPVSYPIGSYRIHVYTYIIWFFGRNTYTIIHSYIYIYEDKYTIHGSYGYVQFGFESLDWHWKHRSFQVSGLSQSRSQSQICQIWFSRDGFFRERCFSTLNLEMYQATPHVAEKIKKRRTAYHVQQNCDIWWKFERKGKRWTGELSFQFCLIFWDPFRMRLKMLSKLAALQNSFESIWFQPKTNTHFWVKIVG